jgi:hypothetical protein
VPVDFGARRPNVDTKDSHCDDDIGFGEMVNNDGWPAQSAWLKEWNIAVDVLLARAIISSKAGGMRECQFSVLRAMCPFERTEVSARAKAVTEEKP